MSFTVVVGAAPEPGQDSFYAALLMQARLVIAADAAAEWCIGLGVKPEVAIGDFDSAEPGATQRLAAAGVEVLERPADKNETDLELAVDLARIRSSDPIVVTAAFTRRLDHTLAALGTLLRAGLGASVREPGWGAVVVSPRHPVTLDLVAGTLVSILAVGDASGVTLSGTRWLLASEDLCGLSGRGVSNTALGGVVGVAVEVGTLLVIAATEDASGGIY
jgi:thiamine pyrophosphokinase